MEQSNFESSSEYIATSIMIIIGYVPVIVFFAVVLQKTTNIYNVHNF